MKMDFKANRKRVFVDDDPVDIGPNMTLMQAASSSDGCMYCRKDGLLGMGDKVSPLVPMEDIHLDIPAAA
jgi:hypothetical protein